MAHVYDCLRLVPSYQKTCLAQKLAYFKIAHSVSENHLVPMHGLPLRFFTVTFNGLNYETVNEFV